MNSLRSSRSWKQNRNLCREEERLCCLWYSFPSSSAQFWIFSKLFTADTRNILQQQSQNGSSVCRGRDEVEMEHHYKLLAKKYSQVCRPSVVLFLFFFRLGKISLSIKWPVLRVRITPVWDNSSIHGCKCCNRNL